MAGMALSYAVRLFYQVLSWFGVLLNASGTRNIYISFVTIAIVYRLLIAPLVGHSLRAGSDTVKAPRTTSIERQEDN